MEMTVTVTPAPYELVDTHYTFEGKCIRCLDRIGIGYRWYKNLETQEEVSIDIRTTCHCTPEKDPYKIYCAPRWKRIPKTRDWLVPQWDTEQRKWVYHPHPFNGV